MNKDNLKFTYSIYKQYKNYLLSSFFKVYNTFKQDINLYLFIIYMNIKY